MGLDNTANELIDYSDFSDRHPHPKDIQPGETPSAWARRIAAGTTIADERANAAFAALRDRT